MTDIVDTLDIHLIMIGLASLFSAIFMLIALARWVPAPSHKEEKKPAPRPATVSVNAHVESLIRSGRLRDAMDHVQKMIAIAIDEGNHDALRVYRNYERKISV